MQKLLTFLAAKSISVYAIFNANAKAAHILSAKNISVYVIFKDQNLNYTLTNDIVSFEQLGSDFFRNIKGTCSTNGLQI